MTASTGLYLDTACCSCEYVYVLCMYVCMYHICIRVCVHICMQLLVWKNRKPEALPAMSTSTGLYLDTACCSCEYVCVLCIYVFMYDICICEYVCVLYMYVCMYYICT